MGKRKVTKVEKADQRVAKAAAAARRSAPVRFLGWLSEAADQPQLISICAATLAAGLVTRNARLARTGARMLAAELLATTMKSAVKHRIDRTRPRVVDDGGDYAMKPGSSHSSGENSFPSGHTAGAVAVARAFVRDYREHRVAAYGTALAVAAIQIPRCQHYPSDLAAGALVGLAAEEVLHIGEVLAPPLGKAVAASAKQARKSGSASSRPGDAGTGPA